MPETTLENRPGFQGSETSRIEVDIYQHGDDPVVLYSDGGLYNLHGRRASDPSHCVVGVQTSKTLGAGSGQFSITIKPSKVAEAIFQWLVDDDWVDLVFYRHDQPSHVMRGLVDEVRRSKIVGGTSDFRGLHYHRKGLHQNLGDDPGVVLALCEQRPGDGRSGSQGL